MLITLGILLRKMLVANGKFFEGGNGNKEN